MMQEIRQSLRSLRRSPGPGIVIVVTLGLAIGGATAIFSFVDGVLLRPLDYPDADRLVMLCESHVESSNEWCSASPANLADWARESHTLAAAGLARSWHFSLRDEERLLSVRGGVATPGIVEVFGSEAVLGRAFEPGDLLAGRERAALLSNGFWQRQFGADPGVLGSTVELNGDDYTVVGVLPEDFAVPDLDGVEIWIALWHERAESRSWRGFRAHARLEDGATIAKAQAELELISKRLALEYPDTNTGWSVLVESLHERTVRPVKPALLALLGAVLLVLLIACVNVANLLLARATVRRRELAVRAALGAGAGRIARQLGTEGLLLAAAGGAAGAVIATWTVELFVQMAPAGFPRLGEVAIDARALTFTCLAALATCLLFSLAPVLGAVRLDVREAIRASHAGGERRESVVLRRGLVVTELALALILLVSGGLLAKSFQNLLDWSPGFDRDGLVMVQVFAPTAKYPEARDVIPLYRRAVEELASLPGVVSAGAGSAGPLFGGDGSQEFYLEGRPEPANGEKPRVDWYDVGPRYFATLGISPTRGRAFSEDDAYGGRRVAIVNQALVDRHIGDVDPIGIRLRLVVHEMTVEIVGVVPNVAPFMPGAAVQPEIYWPYMQSPRGAIHFLVRSQLPPEQLIRSARARLLAIDPDLVMGRFFTLEDQVERQLVTPRFNAALLGGFAVLATLIAGVGAYGVVAFTVGQRSREIAVRMALGARRRDVLESVLRSGAQIAAAGVVVGIVGASMATRLMSSLLVGVEPFDPGIVIAAAMLLTTATLVASYVPARRASRVDPATVLRHE